MNGIDTQKNHVRFIAMCITILGVGCIAGGTILIYKGFGGDLLIGGGLAAISGLCGFLGAGRPIPPPQDITLTGQPPKVEVTHPQATEEKEIKE